MLGRLVLLVASLAFGTANATPVQLNQQGRLIDSGGAPIHGTHNLTVRLYNAGGTEVFAETFTSTMLESGFYAVQLGAGSTVLDHTDVAAATEVGITVDTGAELTPRSPLATAPHAVQSTNSDTVGGLAPTSFALPGTYTMSWANCAWTGCMDTPTTTGCPTNKVIRAVDFAASDSQKPIGCTSTNHEDEVRYLCCEMRFTIPAAQ